MKNDDLDRFIFSRVGKNELEIPAEVRDAVRRRIGALAGQPGPSVWKRAKVWAPLLAATLLVIVLSLPLIHPSKPPGKKITQIRTEFTIPAKNIKIIWVQRDDFYLPETNG
ncbi:MAG: hypothetical protein NTW95_09510 [Candidatus Aminicenantes bacterium]|nr:hypothetical protein [Candidatus Aminicenantes bacterium]